VKAKVIDELLPEEDTDFDLREIMRIEQSMESPLQAYARYLARLGLVNPRMAEVMRIKFPLTRLVKADFEYAKMYWKNRVLQVMGSTGCLTLDSLIQVIEGGRINEVSLGRLIKEKKEFLTSAYDIENNKIVLTSAKAVSSGIKRVYKLTFENGKTLGATQDHKFIKFPDNKEVTLKELDIGDKILCFDKSYLVHFCTEVWRNNFWNKNNFHCLHGKGRKKYYKNRKILFGLKIINIEEFGEQEVGDLVVPDYNRFVLPFGVITHNSGKSISSIEMAHWIDPDFWTHNKGNYDLPKEFWDYGDLLNYVRAEASPGDCLVLDEEPRLHGLGSRTLQDAIQNLEAQVRFNKINFIFVYAIERSHRVHTLFYTRGEHPTKEIPKMDYFVLGVLQPILEHHQLLGLMTVDVPPQGVVEAYNKRKEEYTNSVQRSGGFGAEQDIIEQYKVIAAKLPYDKDYQKLQHKGERTDYVSYKYRVPTGLAKLLVTLVSEED